LDQAWRSGNSTGGKGGILREEEGSRRGLDKKNFIRGREIELTRMGHIKKKLLQERSWEGQERNDRKPLKESDGQKKEYLIPT